MNFNDSKIGVIGLGYVGLPLAVAFAEKYKVRELQLIPIKEEEEAFEGTEVQFESVDQIVISQLETIDSQVVDKDKLIELYREIIV